MGKNEHHANILAILDVCQRSFNCSSSFVTKMFALANAKPMASLPSANVPRTVPLWSGVLKIPAATHSQGEGRTFIREFDRGVLLELTLIWAQV